MLWNKWEAGSIQRNIFPCLTKQSWWHYRAHSLKGQLWRSPGSGERNRVLFCSCGSNPQGDWSFTIRIRAWCAATVNSTLITSSGEPLGAGNRGSHGPEDQGGHPWLVPHLLCKSLWAALRISQRASFENEKQKENSLSTTEEILMMCQLLYLHVHFRRWYYLKDSKNKSLGMKWGGFSL